MVAYKPTAHEIKNQTIKDLVFVMSEVVNYLQVGNPLNHSKCMSIFKTIDFLEMIVSVISMKNLHIQSNSNAYYEELLHFGCKSVSHLITKLPSLEEKLIDKVF